LSVLVALLGCAEQPPPAKGPPVDPGAAFLNDPKPLRYRSARFELSLPLPDGRGWKIDDHKTPMLVATHAATDGVVTLDLGMRPELMNRQRCEADARARRLVNDADLQTVADEVIVGPAQYDSRVAVMVAPGANPHQALAGHVYLFGSYLRKCLFVHYETRQRPGENEETLSARLAVARLQILGGIKVEAFDAPDLRGPR
jgi:hypothetical protein